MLNMAVQDTKDGIDISQIENLIQRYQKLSDYDRRQKNEADVRQEFINPFLRALGWDTTTDRVKPEQRTHTGHADYALSLNGHEQFFIEAKRFAKDLNGERRIDSTTTQSYVEQAIDYAWHQRCDWAVLTNFAELRLYWTHVNKDTPEEGLVFQLTADEFLTEDGLDKLTNLSKSAVKNGSLRTLERTRQRASITAEVRTTLSDARTDLTMDIHKNHAELDRENLHEGVQRILDRLVVIRVAEDRGVIDPDTLRQMVETWENTTTDPDTRQLVPDLAHAFRDVDSIYNSALFAEHECENWEISNHLFKEILRELYKYNFEFIDADILGNIYEEYLGLAIEGSAEELELADRSDGRREDGIYYTPVQVVEYIVNSTLGNRLDSLMEGVRANLQGENPNFEKARESFDKIKEVRFLDISCGSGSFLIKAYDRFIECYEEFDRLTRDARKNNTAVRDYETGTHQIPDSYRQRILRDNLFAVDLDPQATEIASVNLFLKALEHGENPPTLLEENVRCGNSLLNGSVEEVADVLGITDGEAEKLGAFDWKSEFNDVFNRSGDGFTVIAGNPPWGAEIDSYRDWIESDDNYELATGQYDSYDLFLELTGDLLEDGGTLGFIIPDSILREEHEATRKWLAENHQLDRIHKLGEGVFEDVWAGSVILQYTTTLSNGENIVECSVLRKEDRNRMQGAGGDALESLIHNRLNTKRQQRILDEDDYNFRVFADETDYEILDIMETNTVDTSEILFDFRGDEIGKSGEVMRCPNCMEWDTYPRSRAASKGGGYYPKICTHCDHKYNFENAVETRDVIKEEDSIDNWKKLYFGEHVARYRESGRAYIDDTISGIDFEPESLYEPPKILLRKTGFGFNAMLDNSDARCLQVVFVFRLQDDREGSYDKYDLEYFLGLLNSRIMLYYYTKERSEIEWQSYPYKTQGLVMGLPYPEIDWDDDEQAEKYDRFVELVREASQSDGQIDSEKDWEIERLAHDFYGIPSDKQNRITDELHELQRLQVVRELFPGADDE